MTRAAEDMAAMRIFLAYPEIEKDFVERVKDSIVKLSRSTPLRGAGQPEGSGRLHPIPVVFYDKDAGSKSLSECTTQAAKASVLLLFVPRDGFERHSVVDKEVLAFLTRTHRHSSPHESNPALTTDEMKAAAKRIRRIVFVDRHGVLYWPATGAPPTKLPAICVWGCLRELFQTVPPRLREQSPRPKDVAVAALARLWRVEPEHLLISDRVGARQRVIYGVVAAIAIGVFAAFFAAKLLPPRGPECAAPTPEQKEHAEKAIALIEVAETQAEDNYFDPEFHTGLGLGYAYAFLAHCDNRDYLERMIEEWVVSLSLKDNPETRRLLEQCYTAYHELETPRTLYTRSHESFERWLELAKLQSPRVENVRLVFAARSDLDAAYRSYELSAHSGDEVAMSYEATKRRIHETFLVATHRRELRVADGRLFMTPAYFKKWSEAVHSVGFASSNELGVKEVYDRALPPDATLIHGGEDRGCYRVAPNLVITPGVKYFQQSRRSLDP